jgi:hypothetical protein
MSNSRLRAVKGPASGAGSVFTAQDGTEIVTTKFHWFGERLILCPVCDCAPCDADCTEQKFPLRPRR